MADRVRAAEQEAAARVERARAQGREDGAAVLAVEGARARRAARSLVLRAQREVYEELRARCREAVGARCASPAGNGLRAGLAQQVRHALGPDAVVEDDPGGGVVGVLGCRRVDLSAATLADRAIASLGAQVEELWAP